MAQTSVAQFAGELKLMPAVLLEQLRAAGVNKTVVEDTLSDHDKTRLLEYLRRSHGAAESKTKITLTRKQTSEIKKADSTGKSRTIQVEVRKKRVFVKRESGDTATLSSGRGRSQRLSMRTRSSCGNRRNAVRTSSLPGRQPSWRRSRSRSAVSPNSAKPRRARLKSRHVPPPRPRKLLPRLRRLRCTSRPCRAPATRRRRSRSSR